MNEQQQFEKRKSDINRRMTLRRMTSSFFQKQLEISFINECMFYNIILRGQQMKTRNSFIIFDFSSGDSYDTLTTPISCSSNMKNIPCFSGENVIRMLKYPKIIDALLALHHSQQPLESFNLVSITSQLSKEDELLFARRMRMYNLVVPFYDAQSSFNQIYKNSINEFLKNSSNNHELSNPLFDELLYGGTVKISKQFFLTRIFSEINQSKQFSNASQELTSSLAALTFYSILKNSKVRDIYALNTGCSSFFNQYSFMPQFIEDSSQHGLSSAHQSQLTLPNEVFAGRFFYGNWKHASLKSVFDSTGITHVLNVTKEVQNYFEDTNGNLIHNDTNGIKQRIEYLRIDIEDTEDADIAQHFQQAFQFLKNALLTNSNNKVFVHCAQGKSRSATMVCVFFMRIFQWSYEETIQYVKSRRDIACPNSAFEEQLRNFEKNKFRFSQEIAQTQQFKECKDSTQMILSGETYKKSNELKDEFIRIAFKNGLEKKSTDNLQHNSEESEDEDDYFEEGSAEEQIFQAIEQKHEKIKKLSLIESSVISQEDSNHDELLKKDSENKIPNPNLRNQFLKNNHSIK